MSSNLILNIKSLETSFFYDESTVKQDTLSLDELRGHLILLSKMNDASFHLAALLDGSSIDFLFGIKRNSIDSRLRKRLSSVKAFIRSLSEDKQVYVAEFYSSLYQAVVIYHSKIESCGRMFYFCNYMSAETVFREQVSSAFQKLVSKLSK